MKSRRGMSVVVGVVALVATVWAQVKAGDKIKGFNAKTLDGQTVKVSVAKDQLAVAVGSKASTGKPLLLNFWG